MYVDSRVSTLGQYTHFIDSIPPYRLVNEADLHFFCGHLKTSPYSGDRLGMMYIEK